MALFRRCDKFKFGVGLQKCDTFELSSWSTHPVPSCVLPPLNEIHNGVALALSCDSADAVESS